MTHLQKGILYTIIGGIFWGFSGMVSQHLMKNMDMTPLLLSNFRMLGSGILLFFYLIWKMKKELFEIWKEKNSVRDLLLFSIIGLTFNQITFLLTIRHTNAGTATVLQYLSPLILLFSIALYRRKLPKGKEMIALVLSIFGVYLIATGGNPTELAISERGLFYGLISAVALTLYNVLPVKILEKYGALVVTCWGMMVGGIAMTVFYQPWNHLPAVNLSFIGNTFFVILVGTVIPYALYLKGIEMIGPVKASMIIAVEPISATAFAAIFLGTIFTIVDLVGFLCILSSIFFLSKDKEKSVERESLRIKN